MTSMRKMASLPLSVAAAGAVAVAYGALVERTSPRLRRVEVPLLPAGSSPLRILHFSDAHLLPGQAWKRDWLRGLAELQPDLVINTGDSIAHPDSVPPFLDAIAPLLERPGAFVFGSNDFNAPVFKNPVRYLLPDDGERVQGAALPWRELGQAMSDAGWLDLSNARGHLTADGRRLVASIARQRRTAVEGIVAQMAAGRRRALAPALRAFADAAGAVPLTEAWTLGWPTADEEV